MEKMKLRAYIKLEDDGTLTARSELYDGTPFSLTVGEFDVQINEEFTESMREVTGFINVTQLSRQDTRAYIELPGSTIEHGKNVTVHKFKLQPPGATIENFKAPLGMQEVPPSVKPFMNSPIPRELSSARYVDVTPPEEVAKDIARQLSEQEEDA